MKQFVPPMITKIEHPLLPMDPSLIIPPDEKIAAADRRKLGRSAGEAGDSVEWHRIRAGMGSGSGGGIGSGKGGGFGPGEGGGVGGGVFRVGGGVSQPTVIFKVDPEYSEEARKAKYSGSVMLAIIVDTEGHARDIHVVKSLGMGLDEKAVEAVEKWKFKPGMKGGAARERAGDHRSELPAAVNPPHPTKAGAIDPPGSRGRVIRRSALCSGRSSPWRLRVSCVRSRKPP